MAANATPFGVFGARFLVRGGTREVVEGKVRGRTVVIEFPSYAAALYNRGIAPLIITLGGNGGDEYNEGAVGREYLVGMGVPEQDIIAETHSRNTEESARRIAVIARANGLHRLVIVSDGTHLFRIHAICAAEGLNVLTSPRATVPIEGDSGKVDRIAHEILSYTFWRLRLH